MMRERSSGLVEGYVAHQRRRGLGERGIKRRRYTLLALGRWIQPRPLVEASRADIESWVDELVIAGIESRTRYWHISNLACFFRWAVLEELLDVDPTVRIQRPKVSRLLPRPIEQQDLDVALAAADPRMRAWLTLAAYAGLRAQEIAGLRRQDLRDRRSPPVILVVNGKGDKERIVPLNPECAAALRAFGLPRSGWLWPGQRGPLQPGTVTKYCSRFLHGLGIDATIHCLRHYFGTEVYQRSGKDLRLTQELLGHSSPSTTAIYTRWDQRAGFKVVGELHRALDEPTVDDDAA